MIGVMSDGSKPGWPVLAAGIFALLQGCGDGPRPAAGDAGGVDAGVRSDASPNPDAQPVDPWGCARIFSQELLPEYNVEISQDELTALIYEYEHRDEARAMDINPKPYHPISFQYDSQSFQAHIRLKGSFSWNPAETDKMQFVISFNEAGSGGRFYGQRKIELDAPYYDKTILHNRVALSYMRDQGLPAQCANNAKLSINGEYYGVYAQLERIDREFLERSFPEAPDGDLWKNGWDPKNNDVFDSSRIDAFDEAISVPELELLCDLDQAITEWATEAMIPHGDGFWGLERNYYLYDHPTRGFVFIPFDLDASFEWVESDADPIFWTGSWRIGPPNQFLLSIADAARRAQFISEIDAAHAGYDVDLLAGRITNYSNQIRAAVESDPNNSFTAEQWEDAIRAMRGYLAPRSIFVGRWLDCQDTGEGEDLDNDTYVFCNDCDDQTDTIHPGAEEVCGNDLDDDCDGRRDEGCPAI